MFQWGHSGPERERHSAKVPQQQRVGLAQEPGAAQGAPSPSAGLSYTLEVFLEGLTSQGADISEISTQKSCRQEGTRL